MGIRRTLGIVFLAGLFLIGIGGGVTFAEFSSFTLEEEKVVGTEYRETNEVKEKIAQESGNIYVVFDGVKRKNVVIETDANLGPDEIEFETEYNGKALSTYFHVNKEDNEYYFDYYDKDFYWMNYMDDILNSIKHKKIPNYQWEYYGKHVVRVAPVNEERIVVYN